MILNSPAGGSSRLELTRTHGGGVGTCNEHRPMCELHNSIQGASVPALEWEYGRTESRRRQPRIPRGCQKGRMLPFLVIFSTQLTFYISIRGLGAVAEVDSRVWRVALAGPSRRSGDRSRCNDAIFPIL